MSETQKQAETVIIALGSNLGDRWATLDAAVRKIENRIGPVVRRSTWIETEPLLDPADPSPQPNFLNGVVLVSSSAEAEEILRQLQAIEIELGRDREGVKRWAPRTIDLDIVGIGLLVLESRDLVIPHPQMHLRDFVLGPLCEVLPEWIHPTLNRSAAELLAGLS